MDITCDPSIFLAVILNEPTRPELLARTHQARLLSAPSVSWEVGNALTALFKRGRIDLRQALTAIESYEQIPVRLIAVDLAKAVELAKEHSLYAYDSYILECARRSRTPLLSLDEPQRAVARRIGIEVIEV